MWRQLRTKNAVYRHLKHLTLQLQARALEELASAPDVPACCLSASLAALPQLRELLIYMAPDDPLPTSTAEQLWNPFHELPRLEVVTFLGYISPLHRLLLRGALPRTIRTLNLSPHSRQDWPLPTHMIDALSTLVEHVGAPHLTSLTLETVPIKRKGQILLETVEQSTVSLTAFLSKLPKLALLQLKGDSSFLRGSFSALPPSVRQLTLAINADSYFKSRRRDERLLAAIGSWLEDGQLGSAPLLGILQYGLYKPRVSADMEPSTTTCDQADNWQVGLLAAQCEAKGIAFVPLECSTSSLLDQLAPGQVRVHECL